MMCSCRSCCSKKASSCRSNAIGALDFFFEGKKHEWDMALSNEAWYQFAEHEMREEAASSKEHNMQWSPCRLANLAIGNACGVGCIAIDGIAIEVHSSCHRTYDM